MSWEEFLCVFFFKSAPSAILVVDIESCLYYAGVSLEEWKQALV